MVQNYVLLDRDGVINIDSDDYIKSAEEWIPIPQSIEAIALFCKQGYKVVVITNQSGLGRGFYDRAALDKMHHKMTRLVVAQGGEIDSIYYCPHIPEDNCECRKPKPGMLNQFAKDKNRALADIYFVGDKLADINAATSAGARPILVKTGKGKTTLMNNPGIKHPIFENLYDATKYIVSAEKL